MIRANKGEGDNYEFEVIGADRIRAKLCAQILDLPAGELYELCSDISDGIIPYFKKTEEMLECDTCRELYGSCTRGTEETNHAVCQARFWNHLATMDTEG